MNIAILGAGDIAVKMASTLQPLKGANCYAVASRDYSRARAFADKYGFLKAYGSYQELMHDDQVELVYIATPHSHHYEHIKMCIENGKHVLCEKPICANAAQAEEVLIMAEERGIMVAEAMWPRYMPMRETICNMVNSNIIGRITGLSANIGGPMENKERLRRPELAGGALLDVGCYALHFASMVFGDDLKSISASCTKLETGVDAQETIILTYSDGRMASLFSTMLAETDRRAYIYGSNGFIEIENIYNFESVKAYNLERKVIAEYAAPFQITGYEYEVMAAMKAIRHGRVECRELPHETSLHMMKIMDNLRKAFDVVYPFELNPDVAPSLISERMEKKAESSRESSVREISNTESTDIPEKEIDEDTTEN